MLTQDSIDLRRITLFVLYFQYIVVDLRWISVSRLTLLLTASDMDQACETSLIVCGSYDWAGLP